jgi:type II secretory pathway pseudopilin PulG
MRWHQGDTLIEVTFALAILGFVLLGSTAIASTAFRTGQNARERTEVAEVAQEQMEALRSFRDNHTWDQFRNGSGSAYAGVDTVPTATCKFDPNPAYHCFHMELSTSGSTTEWVPKSGALTPGTPGTTLKVPTSTVEITSTGGVNPVCAYNFGLHYQFSPVGQGPLLTNHIATRLANLRFVPTGGVTCP